MSLGAYAVVLALLVACHTEAQVDFSSMVPSMVPGNSANGAAIYSGDLTYYGQQGGQNNWGTCSFGSSVSNTEGLPWTSGIANTIALNNAQFNNSLSCGLCLYYRGTGSGIGTTPPPLTWQFAFVDNLCPECAFGSIDIDANANGRWKADWFPAPCNTGNSTFVYSMDGSNPYWFEFVISNTRVPIAMVEMSSSGTYYQMRRGFNNMWAANGGPFNFPMPLRITSVLGDVVYDELPGLSGGQGKAQFPNRGPATFPAAGAQPVNQPYQDPDSSPPPPPSATGSPRPTPPPASTASQTTSVTPAPIVTEFSRGPTPPPMMEETSHWTTGDANYTVQIGAQCGGDGGWCGSLGQTQCKDAQWEGAQCVSDGMCARYNAGWWQCNPPPLASVAAAGRRMLM